VTVSPTEVARVLTSTPSPLVKTMMPPVMSDWAATNLSSYVPATVYNAADVTMRR